MSDGIRGTKNARATSTVDVTMDMKSIDFGHQGLNDHAQTPDLFDTAKFPTATYTGMGLDINVHDQWAVESMGPIQDRTREHLGYSDRAIIAYRRLLLSAINKDRKSVV